jgi:beta-lactamase superfamily II metal-dependent hydrolase
VKLFRSGDAFAIQSTRKQFARYVDWWSHALFERAIVAESGARSSWTDLGVVAAAADLVNILQRRGGATRAAAATSPPTERSTMTPQERAAPSGAPPAPGPLTSPAPMEAAAKPTPAARPLANNLAATTRTKTTNHNTSGPFFEIEMLPAGHGDCLWIQYGEAGPTSRVLIDCGTDSTYPWLQKRVAQVPLAARDFELFILSHIDADHIGGAIPFFADQTLGLRVADVWFNGYKHLTSTRLGAKQGEIFSTLIQKYKLPWNLWRKGGAIVLAGGELPTCTLPGGMQLTLLSPSPEKLTTLASKWEAEIKKLNLTPGKAADFEKFLGRTVSKSTNVETLADAKFSADTAAPNGSSIAVLAEYHGKRALFGADAHAPLLVASIRKLLKQRGATKLKLDAFKVSHHASQNNLNVELMQLLDCKNYLISTNGKIFNHPDREAIGRVIRDALLPIVFRRAETSVGSSLTWMHGHHIEWDAPVH